jgi:hypothetical protein
MSKLTIDLRTKGKAVAALLKLYKAEADFAQELEKIRTNYVSVLEQWLKIAVPNWIQMKKALTRKEFSTAKDFFLGPKQTISSSLADKLELLLITPDSHLATQLGDYEKILADLAYRRHLKASWAGYALILDHVQDMMFNLMPEDFRNAEIPIEMLEPFLPSAPLKPLKFQVNAYELMFSGRQEIQNKFAKALADYENKLKSPGWRELPSALERHAYWWFEHYIHQKTYDEIAQSEIYTPGGSLISYARNVGTAVRNFARLIGIETADMR